MRLIEEIMNEICEVMDKFDEDTLDQAMTCLLYTSPSPRDTR